MTAKPQPSRPTDAPERRARTAPRAHAAQFLAQATPASALVNQIGRDIVGGVHEAGALLPNEVDMRERFGVSRTALREAYSKLTAKGLVHARPRVGTSVRNRADWNMLDEDVLAWHLQTLPAEEIAADLYALRRMIEPGASRLAASIRSDEDMQAIDDAFAQMKRSTTDEAALVKADYAFHVAILSATGNGFITAFSALIHTAMLAVFEISWRGAEIIRDQRIRQHGDVADAIRAKDPDNAQRLMEELLDSSIEDVREAFEPRNQQS
ncbi:FadR/GntR family transcriptional regulator [Celeribacter arenosi]|uniref:FadR/GntR family transcriptional regulator n=1 Tax=Celeribacter arenosi TaxID=792649 RepID=A0ABP7JYR8_9RHOB